MNAFSDLTKGRLEDHIARVVDAPDPMRRSSWLLYAVLGFTILFLLWAALTELDTTVHAPGRAVPSARLQQVSNLEGGIVGAIHVQAGQFVAKGAPLISLDRTQSGAEYGSAQAMADALAMKIARLTAEVEGREPVYPAPRNALEEQQLRIERALHTARMAELASLGAAGGAQVAQARSAIAEAAAAAHGRSAQASAVTSQLTAMKPLVDRGIEPTMTLVELQGQVAVANANVAAASAGVARSRAALGEAAATAIRSREQWRATIAAELSQLSAEYAARLAQLPALGDKVRRAVVRAPMAGRVNRVLVSTVGGSVAAGAPLVELVPVDGTVTFEAKVRPSDIGTVRMGQPARINVTAYDAAIHGSMRGRVVTIAPDALVEERTGESYYIVRVEGQAGSLVDAAGRPLRVGPGMTADINLLGQKRSILAYLLTPITRLRDNALRE